jgi:hypothetical protein
METPALPPDDLTDLERRLSAWRPSETGLTPDAMLFTAGRASARGAGWRFVWPTVSGCLALVAVGLGMWLAAERSERLALARRLEHPLEQPAPAVVAEPSVTPPADENLAADRYLTLRREWEQHPGDGVPRPKADRTPTHPAAPEPPVLRAWQPQGPPESL